MNYCEMQEIDAVKAENKRLSEKVDALIAENKALKRDFETLKAKHKYSEGFQDAIHELSGLLKR